MKEKNSSSAVVSETNSTTSQSSTEEAVQRHWQGVVKRRSFLKGLGIAGATLSAGALVGTEGNAQTTRSASKLSQGDAALLRFAAAAEIIEADLWQQYNELGGVQGGNPAYIAALSNLDGDMPQYISDNTDDELSHAAFLNAYLISKGEEPVDLLPFRNLPSSKATGAKDVKRLTNLLKLNVDLSWYTRYRSTQNPDFGVKFKGPFTIENQPAIPLNDNDTPPDQTQPVPPATKQEARMQAIANTAGFHFATIEQGGTSLYPQLAQRVTNLEVLRILLSIGGTEIMHFQTWSDKAGNAPPVSATDPVTGVSVTFPDLNSPPLGGEDFQTNLIMPEPTIFLNKKFPACSIIRPTKTMGAAKAALDALTADGLFIGQSKEFFRFMHTLAFEADLARREDF